MTKKCLYKYVTQAIILFDERCEDYGVYRDVRPGEGKRDPGDCRVFPCRVVEYLDSSLYLVNLYIQNRLTHLVDVGEYCFSLYT